MLFASEAVNTGRQKELDVAKGITILFMILAHILEEIGSDESYLYDALLKYIEAPVGANLFMFCMGIGIAYSKHNTARGCANRGILLLTLGQVLQLIRYPLIISFAYFIHRDAKLLSQICLVISVDIMQLAGLSFLVIGALNKLRANEAVIFVISIFMSLLGMKLEGVGTGNYFIDQLLGFFWGTDTESYFPLFNWFIFIAAGLWFGKLYKHLADKKRFFMKVFALGIPLIIFYCILVQHSERPILNSLFRFSADNMNSITHVNIINALCCLGIIVTYIGFLWLISAGDSPILPESISRPLEFISHNINKFYCVSWCVILFTEYLLYFSFSSLTNAAVLCAWVMITLITAGIVMFYNRYFEKNFIAFFSKHKVFWTSFVWGVSIIIATIAFSAFDEYPNYLNNYLGY